MRDSWPSALTLHRLLTVHVFPPGAQNLLFPLAILAGGIGAALVGFLVAIPSFKTRGDYLAIVTLAFCMIVKSVLENIDAVGGPRGLLGMEKLTTLPWVFFWTALIGLGDPQPRLFQFRTRRFVHPRR